MLRPIDTQTIYQQSHEVSNRQQIARQETEMQQTQFSNILHKETAQKQESVNEVPQEDQIKNQLDQKEGRKGQSEEKRKYKRKKDKETKSKDKDSSCHIDIRI